jgi:hypothetical protein
MVSFEGSLAIKLIPSDCSNADSDMVKEFRDSNSKKVKIDEKPDMNPREPMISSSLETNRKETEGRSIFSKSYTTTKWYRRIGCNSSI